MAAQLTSLYNDARKMVNFDNFYLTGYPEDKNTCYICKGIVSGSLTEVQMYFYKNHSSVQIGHLLNQSDLFCTFRFKEVWNRFSKKRVASAGEMQYFLFTLPETARITE